MSTISFILKHTTFSRFAQLSNDYALAKGNLHDTPNTSIFAHSTSTHILTRSVPMQQYPQSPNVTGATQPPVYHQDPNAAQYQQQLYQQQYPQHPQQSESPPSQQLQSGQYQIPYEQQQKACPPSQQPGMPPQQHSGPVYQNATPIASLGRGPAPSDFPACGQTAMTNCAFETGNTTQ